MVTLDPIGAILFCGSGLALWLCLPRLISVNPVSRLQGRVMGLLFFAMLPGFPDIGNFDLYERLTRWSYIAIFWLGPLMSRLLMLAFPDGPEKPEERRRTPRVAMGILGLLPGSAALALAVLAEIVPLVFAPIWEDGQGIIFLLLLVHLSVYACLIVGRSRRAEGLLKQSQASERRASLTWFRAVAGLYSGVLLWAGLIFALTAFTPWKDPYFYLIRVSNLGCLACLLSLGSRTMPDGPPPATKRAKGTADGSREQPDAFEFDCVREALEVRRAWLDPELDLTGLSRICGLSRTAVSRAINLGYGTTFFDVVNTFRARHAADHLVSTVDNRPKLTEIALEAGFGSKASFNRYFLKVFGCAPVAYRRTRGNASQAIP